MSGKHVICALAGALALCLAGAVGYGQEFQNSFKSIPAPRSGGSAWFRDLFPEKLVKASGKKVDTNSALGGKTVGLYFSASWCGPCRKFTPQLVKFYKETAEKNNLEIVFVSLDREKSAMMNYMKKDAMPFLAVPFEEASHSKALKEKLSVFGIPRLIIFDSEGKILSQDARWDVVMLGEGAAEAWKSPDYKPKTYKDYQASGTRNAGSGSVKSGSAGERAGGNPQQWKQGPSRDWHIRMDTALDAARRERRKLFLLNTGSDWCGWCKKLYKDVLSQPEFIEFARKNLILVYLDIPMRGMPELQKLYNREVGRAMRFHSGGVPCAFLYDEDGRFLDKISGYRPRDRYMQDLREILNKRPSSSALPPAWLMKSPRQILPMLEDLQKKKQEAFERSRKTIENAKQESSFEVAAWGLKMDKVDRPFDPRREIRVRKGTYVYFKVRYRIPEKLRTILYLRMPAVSVSSVGQRVSGSGEFVSMLCYKRPSSQNKLLIHMRLAVADSPTLPVAELPCKVVWE